jgi:hypothetical protein
VVTTAQALPPSRSQWITATVAGRSMVDDEVLGKLHWLLACNVRIRPRAVLAVFGKKAQRLAARLQLTADLN